jgi:hypothetical protein
MPGSPGGTSVGFPLLEDRRRARDDRRVDLVEAARIAFVVIGGVLAVALTFAPSLACRRYVKAVVEGRDRRAGFWAFLAAAGGSGPDDSGTGRERFRAGTAVDSADKSPLDRKDGWRG